MRYVIDQLRVIRKPAMTALRLPQPVRDVAQGLEVAIRRAVDGKGLETALEAVQRAFEAGRLFEQDEQLAVLAAREAGCRPESEEASEVRLSKNHAPQLRARAGRKEAQHGTG